MRRLSTIFGTSKSRKHSSQPKPRLFESLEKREMMAVTPLYYATTPIQPATSQQVTVANNLTPQGTLQLAPVTSMPNVPAFSSRPGASATLYLDFDGFNRIPDRPDMELPAFDIGGNPQDFLAERNLIHEIWARVAEDYSPFNINVTTVDPGEIANDSRTLRVVITGEDFRQGSDAGGYGRVNCFSDPTDPNVVFVFSVSKGTAEDDPAGLRPMKSIGNLVSHEAGHAFGLQHYPETETGGEYDTGDAKKAPIMGNANGSERGIWWKGYNKYGDMQWDLETIASVQNGFGFAPDGKDSFDTAGQMQVGGSGLEVSGVIHYMSDVDVYRFDTIGGNVAISVLTAKVDTGGGQIAFFGNLDAVVELYNNQGQLIKREAPDTSTTAGITVPDLAAGSYFVKVLSQGAYGDVGQYQISVQEFTPPRVVSSNYVSLSSTLAGVWVQFNKRINASTFTTADVKATGVSVLGITADANDPTRFLVTVTKPSVALWSLTIGPDIRDLVGQMLDQNRDGIQGSAADVYTAYFTSPNLPSLEQAKPTSKTIKSNLNPATVDAVFAG